MSKSLKVCSGVSYSGEGVVLSDVRFDSEAEWIKLNGVVLTAQFRTVSGGQYAVSRAFNHRLKKLVDNCDEVHFAQTYPQQVMVPAKAALEHEPPEAGAKTVNP